MNEPLFPKGTIFTCEGGHPQATAAVDIYAGDTVTARNVHGLNCADGAVIPGCSCGAPWAFCLYRFDGSIEGGFLHTSAGWVPPIDRKAFAAVEPGSRFARLIDAKHGVLRPEARNTIPQGEPSR